LVSTQGDCYAEDYKNIVVEYGSGLPSPGDAQNPFIEEFDVTPNPSNGQFEIHIVLAESSPVALRIFDVNGNHIITPPVNETLEEYNIPMVMTMSSGMYFIILETAEETRVARLLIM